MEVPSNGLRKGSWTVQEDDLLRQCIEQYGEGTWHKVPLRAGLNRCRKSCRLRWLNYLQPSIKRGKLGSDEVDLLLRLHKLLGNRWSLIAGRLPGLTANDIKNYWNTHLSKKHEPSSSTKKKKKNTTCPEPALKPTKDQGRLCISPSTEPNKKVEVIKPKPRNFSSSRQKVESSRLGIKDGVVKGKNNNTVCDDHVVTCNKDHELVNEQVTMDIESMWWESLLDESEVANMVGTKEDESSLMKTKSSSAFDIDELWNLLNEDNEQLD